MPDDTIHSEMLDVTQLVSTRVQISNSISKQWPDRCIRAVEIYESHQA